MNLFKQRGTAMALAAALVAAPVAAIADGGYPYPNMQVHETSIAYKALVEKVVKAVKAQPDLNVLSRASATMGAKSLGKTIAGNAVIMVYGPKYAVRMLDASIHAGIEAPLVLYVTENADGGATLTYRQPSEVFKPYGSAKLDEMAAELDTAFTAIAKRALQ